MTWKNEKKSKALLVVFGIYLALLVWCILFKFALRPEEIPHLRGINLIPYAASVVVNGKVQISEIIENMLVFLPFGLCISAFYPDSEIQNRILLASGHRVIAPTRESDGTAFWRWPGRHAHQETEWCSPAFSPGWPHPSATRARGGKAAPTRGER